LTAKRRTEGANFCYQLITENNFRVARHPEVIAIGFPKPTCRYLSHPFENPGQLKVISSARTYITPSSHYLGSKIRFGVFEIDLRAGELRKNGIKLKASGQPFQVLTILLERPGEIVTLKATMARGLLMAGKLPLLMDPNCSWQILTAAIAIRLQPRTETRFGFAGHQTLRGYDSQLSIRRTKSRRCGSASPMAQTCCVNCIH
jgi:hypothetical protein